jgi:hypothetical protein
MPRRPRTASLSAPFLVCLTNNISLPPSLCLYRLLAWPETDEDVREALRDLKVLGRKDFKLLLKWRLQMRKHLSAEVRPMRTVYLCVCL